MKIVGLTGGIGSGKSTVANMFAELGVPVYIADKEARRLTNSSKIIRRKVEKLFGAQAYVDDKLDREFIANIVFKDADKLAQLNQIIHPKVAAHFARWVKKQEGLYCIKEAAILFENGGYKKCDKTILVTAPKQERIRRVMERDAVSRESVESRMQHQWSDKKKSALSDLIIENISLEQTAKEVRSTHNYLLNLYA